MIASGAAFIGVLANHTLRVFGAATFTGVLALALRVALILLFNAEPVMRVNAWVLALLSLVLVDLWYAYRRGAWVGAVAAAAVGMGIMLMTLFRQVHPSRRAASADASSTHCWRLPPASRLRLLDCVLNVATGSPSLAVALPATASGSSPSRSAQARFRLGGSLFVASFHQSISLANFFRLLV
jgi:hypothetical protein